jgi:hypothetical protein
MVETLADDGTEWGDERELSSEKTEAIAVKLRTYFNWVE